MISTIFLIPFMMIIIGYIMYRFPPKKINYFIGYRTRKSMKSKKNWDFANKFCAKLWFNTGLVMLVITIVLLLLNIYEVIILTEANILIIIFLELIMILLAPFIVENKLKKLK